MIKKDVLLNELKVLLFEYNNKKDIVDYVIEELDKRSLDKLNKFMQGGISLDLANETELGVFVSILYEKTKEEKLDPSRYWFSQELREINMHRGERIKGKEEGIVFEDVTQVSDDVWITYLTLAQAKELQDRQIIAYNKEAQRSLKVYQYGNRIIEKIDVDRQEVKEIAEKMINGSYKIDTISFNVSADDLDSEIAYDPETRRLIINGFMEVNDGFHRFTGMLEAYKVNPESDFRLMLKITNYSLSDAKDAIAQFDKQRKLKIEHAKSLEQSNDGMVVAQEINKSPKSEFKGKIVKDKIMISKGMGITFFSTVADSVNLLFKDDMKTKRDVKKVSRFMIEASNYIYDRYLDDFKNENSTSLVKHQNAFIVFTGLAKLIYEDGEWSDDKEETLDMMLDEIDFSVGGELDDVTKLGAARTSNRLILKIKKYLENKF